MNKNYKVLDELVQKTQELHRAIFDKGYDQGYNEGLEDAWDCAKKIALNPVDDGIDVNTLSRIFRVGSDVPYKIMKNFSAQEAIDKIKAWEEKQDVTDIDVGEIEVGDEVNYLHGGRKLGHGVVVSRSVDNRDCWNIVFDDGDTQVCHKDKLQKTGRTFSQISEVLELLKER